MYDPPLYFGPGSDLGDLRLGGGSYTISEPPHADFRLKNPRKSSKETYKPHFFRLRRALGRVKTILYRRQEQKISACGALRPPQARKFCHLEIPLEGFLRQNYPPQAKILPFECTFIMICKAKIARRRRKFLGSMSERVYDPLPFVCSRCTPKEGGGSYTLKSADGSYPFLFDL